MKRKIKKFIASILCFSLIVGTTAFAQEPVDDIVLDKSASPYLKGIEEDVEIDGTMYSYKYSLKNGNKVTQITNEETSETDILVYDEEKAFFI